MIQDVPAKERRQLGAILLGFDDLDLGRVAVEPPVRSQERQQGRNGAGFHRAAQAVDRFRLAQSRIRKVELLSIRGHQRGFVGAGVDEEQHVRVDAQGRNEEIPRKAGGAVDESALQHDG